MGNFIDIEVDQKSVKLVENGLKRYGIESVKALWRAITRTAFAIETDAKERLAGNLGSARHIVTGRLRSSIHVEYKGANTFKGVAASKGSDGKLNVPIEDLEAVVGTNVEYAPKIEFDYDSFMRFGTTRQSKNLSKRVEKEFKKLDKKL
jgi:phage gpG-like protein